MDTLPKFISEGKIWIIINNSEKLKSLEDRNCLL